MWTDRQTAVHCSPLRRIAETSQNASVPLWCAADHYGALQRIVETLWKACRPLWCITMHAVHVLHPAVELHHILSHLAIIVVHYRNVTESSGTTGTLEEHYDALQCTAVHCGASSTCCGGVHHTLTETPNSIHLPHHPFNPQKLTANP